MGLKTEPLKCIGCLSCEMACGYYHDEAITNLSSSVMIYRAEEKKNYFGIMIKRSDDILVGKPEGVECKRPGSDSGGSESASAKPILIRPTCDLCGDAEEYNCVRFCPTGAITKE